MILSPASKLATTLSPPGRCSTGKGCKTSGGADLVYTVTFQQHEETVHPKVLVLRALMALCQALVDWCTAHPLLPAGVQISGTHYVSIVARMTDFSN